MELEVEQMSRGRLTPEQTAHLADQLEALLACLDADEMSASAATRYRIEGAVAALQAVSGRLGSSLTASLGLDDGPLDGHGP
jgi:hypothetical protein